MLNLIISLVNDYERLANFTKFKSLKFLFRVEGQAVSNDDMRILHKVELELVKDILKFISKQHLNKILGKPVYILL